MNYNVSEIACFYKYLFESLQNIMLISWKYKQGGIDTLSFVTWNQQPDTNQPFKVLQNKAINSDTDQCLFHSKSMEMSYKFKRSC